MPATRTYVCGAVLAWEYASLLLGILLTFSAEGSIFQSGRHVCLQQRQSAQPVPYRQSYNRAVYRQTMQMCEDFRVCSRLTLTYQMSYRTVFHMQIRTQLVHGCCPGWQQISPYDNNCNEPVCTLECQNGGLCVGPDTCECEDGWTGLSCEEDIDECKGSNKCEQICENLQGGYECSCHDGFKIMDDNVSCKICLSCLDEFKEMRDTISSLTNRVQELEVEKDILLLNLTSIAEHYEHAMDEMEAFRAATPSPKTEESSGSDRHDYEMDPDTLPFDRLASLSEQISLLEERMAYCTCRDNDEPRT